MLMTKLNAMTALIAAIAVIGAKGGEPKATVKTDTWASALLTEKFEETQKLIKPQPGESRWMQVPWQTSLWKARQLAAAEGKPMFVWSGSGGAPCAPT